MRYARNLYANESDQYKITIDKPDPLPEDSIALLIKAGLLARVLSCAFPILPDSGVADYDKRYSLQLREQPRYCTWFPFNTFTKVTVTFSGANIAHLMF